MKIKWLFPIVFALPMMAQTTLTLTPLACGLATINCNGVAIQQGGSLWIDIYNGTNFIDFFAVGQNELTGLTSTVASDIQTIVPINNATHSANNSYVLHLTSFSGMDATGNPFSGSGTVNFHYYYTKGSGRAGGGAGWHLQIDPSSITVY